MSQVKLEKGDFAYVLRFLISSGNDVEKVKKLISKYPDFMDLADPGINPDGELFGLAMKKHSEFTEIAASAKMLKFLIDLYVQTNCKGDPHSIEYLVKKVKLKNMLEAQIGSSVYEFEELPEEVQAILRPWMPKDEGSDRGEQDLAASDDVLEKDDNTHHGDTDYIDEQPAPEYNNGCLRGAVLGGDLSGDNAHGFSPEVY